MSTLHEEVKNMLVFNHGTEINYLMLAYLCVSDAFGGT